MGVQSEKKNFISNLKIWSYLSIFVKQVFGQGNVLVMRKCPHLFIPMSNSFSKIKSPIFPEKLYVPISSPYYPKPMHSLRVLNSSLMQHMLTAFKISAVGKIVVGGLQVRCCRIISSILQLICQEKQSIVFTSNNVDGFDVVVCMYVFFVVTLSQRSLDQSGRYYLWLFSGNWSDDATVSLK